MIFPEFVPELVSKIRLCAPLLEIVVLALPVPTKTFPVPFGKTFKSTFVSPLAPIDGALPVDAFVISNSFTAEAVV